MFVNKSTRNLGYHTHKWGNLTLPILNRFAIYPTILIWHQVLTLFQDKNADVESLSEAGVNLVKSGDPEAQSAAEKVDTLCKQIQRLHRIVTIRIQISTTYVTFHKLVQQVSLSVSLLCFLNAWFYSLCY